MKNRKHQHENENVRHPNLKGKSTEWKGIKQQRAHFGRVLLLKAMKETMNHNTECGILPGESETKTRDSNERAKKQKQDYISLSQLCHAEPECNIQATHKHQFK